MPDAVIVDMDGTLCDVRGVRHYVLNTHQRNFHLFHLGASLCPPIPEAVAWVEGHRARGRAILVVTARRARWRYSTRVWLRKWDIPHDWLLMRGDSDDRPDVDVKADLLAEIRRLGFTVIAAADDNPNVVALWEREGIPVTVIPGWDEPDGPSYE